MESGSVRLGGAVWSMALCSCGRMAPCGGIEGGGRAGQGGRASGEARLEHWQSTPRPDSPCLAIGESVLALGWPALASPGRDVRFRPMAGTRG